MEREGTTAGARARAGRVVRGHAWWGPLALVALSLIALAVSPVIVSSRVRRVRREMSEGSDEARVLSNDIEAALALQLFALARLPQGGSARAQYDASVRTELEDQLRLKSVVRIMGPEAVERFAEYRTLSQRWHENRESRVPALPGGRPTVTDEPDSLAEPLSVLAAAQRLEKYCAAISADERVRIQNLERLDVTLAAVLSPFALAGVAIVFWVGTRTRAFAEEAERGRAALAVAVESKAALLRGVTHDVKNPLGAASGYAELLQDGIAGELTPAQRQMIERMQRLVGVAVATLDDLLDLSRAETGDLRIEWQTADLSRLAQESVEDHRSSAIAKHLELRISADRGVLVTTDPSRVRQLLGNLMTNAIKYTSAGGAIHIKTGRRRHADGTGSAKPIEQVGIEIRDSGAGVPAAYRQRIFEEFFRVPGSQDVASGTGVGLAISQRISRLLGGDITLEDAEPHGAIFTLWLPLELDESVRREV